MLVRQTSTQPLAGFETKLSRQKRHAILVSARASFDISKTRWVAGGFPEKNLVPRQTDMHLLSFFVLVFLNESCHEGGIPRRCMSHVTHIPRQK